MLTTLHNIEPEIIVVMVHIDVMIYVYKLYQKLEKKIYIWSMIDESVIISKKNNKAKKRITLKYYELSFNDFWWVRCISVRPENL